jgi:radical SAM family uncharacterized protein/radical SAM-linked protein
VADFFDAILLGDGEEAVLDLAACVAQAKLKKMHRAETLELLSTIEGVYIPSFFRFQYGETGNLSAVVPLKKGYEKVNRRILADIDTAAAPQPPLVSTTKIVHDRLGVEIARGCTRGCRFCQAGVIYRPVRERSPGTVMKLAGQGIAAGGFDELGLLSLSTGDYGCLPELLGALMDTYTPQKVSVSMPSMRVGTLTAEIMAQIKRVRKTGFTVAPEAGSERLRLLINKGISEEDLLATCEAAFSLGWNLIKFYFMIGLPTETAEDVEAIVQLAQRALQKAPKRSCTITISISSFVPKPHTPFQWEPQISIEEGLARIDLLKKALPRKGLKLKWHDPRQSFLEGVFSRGDRRLSEVIEQAWHKGARLDGWSEHFDLNIWKEAAAACGLALEPFLNRRNMSSILPWQHLNSGIDIDFLKAEYVKALAGEYTPDCRVHGCQKCGVCDFKKIKPKIYQDAESSEKILPEKNHPEKAEKREGDASRYFYRVDYSKTGEIRFLGHLELIQVVYRALNRMKLPLAFSQGFNPTPKVSFSPALPVGTESKVEYFYFELTEPVGETTLNIDSMNQQFPEGISIQRVTFLPTGNAEKKQGPLLLAYEVTLPRPISEEQKSKLQAFGDAAHFSIQLIKKGKMREFDARPFVKKIDTPAEARVHLTLLHETGKAGIKPLELVQAIIEISEEEKLLSRVMKLECKAVK